MSLQVCSPPGKSALTGGSLATGNDCSSRASSPRIVHFNLQPQPGQSGSWQLPMIAEQVTSVHSASHLTVSVRVLISIR